MEMVEKIQQILLENKFKQESDLVYIWEKEMQLPGNKLIINGQEIYQPGPEVIRKVTVEFFGQGSITGNDSCEDLFEEIHFKIEDLDRGGHSGNVQEIVEGFYPEDLNQVTETIKRLVI